MRYINSYFNNKKSSYKSWPKGTEWPKKDIFFSLLNLCLINNQNVNNSIVLNYNYMDIQHNLIKDELTQKESRLNDEPGCQTVGKSNSFYMI